VELKWTKYRKRQQLVGVPAWFTSLYYQLQQADIDAYNW